MQIHKIHKNRRIFLSRPTSSSIIVIILIIVIVLTIILTLRRHCELGLNVAWMLTSHRHCWSDQDILLCNSCTIYVFCAVQVRKISRYRTKVSSNREVLISIHTISNREVCIDVSQDKACFKAKFVLQYKFCHNDSKKIHNGRTIFLQLQLRFHIVSKIVVENGR